MDPSGPDCLDILRRAIRVAAGERIYNNRPDAAALAGLQSAGNIDQLRGLVHGPDVIEGPTEQWRPRKPDHSKENTTSLSTVDAEGNMACLTQSLGDGFASGVVVANTGVCMNDFLYWAEADLRGGNPLRPGSRLAFPTAPTTSTVDDASVFALGTPGSYGILQTQPQALVQYVDFKRSLQQAVEEPRARLFDGRIVNPESRIPPFALEELGRRGYHIEATPPWTLLAGGMQAISRDPDAGVLVGAADPRREGYVATA